MKKQLLFVHGGGEGAYEEDRKMAASLRDALGRGCEVRCPKMPGEDSPQYGAWRVRIASVLAELDGEVSLVGHSLGASILLRYISEERTATPIAGTFLVAAPYWGVEDWGVDEYRLVRGAPPADSRPFHVRPELGGGMSELFGRRRLLIVE